MSAEASAEQARERLREEIERVRRGIEEMLAEQGSEGQGTGEGDPGLRRLDRLEERLLRLEGRLEQVERERRYAEWRIHANVELMLDGLLRETRALADRLERAPFAP